MYPRNCLGSWGLWNMTPLTCLIYCMILKALKQVLFGIHVQHIVNVGCWRNINYLRYTASNLRTRWSVFTIVDGNFRNVGVSGNQYISRITRFFPTLRFGDMCGMPRCCKVGMLMLIGNAVPPWSKFKQMQRVHRFCKVLTTFHYVVVPADHCKFVLRFRLSIYYRLSFVND